MERVPRQRLAELDVVVDLPVEADPIAAIGTYHRLVAGVARIDDAEPVVPEPGRGLVVDPQPARIRPAMALARHHPGELGPEPRSTEDARDAAHVRAPPPPPRPRARARRTGARPASSPPGCRCSSTGPDPWRTPGCG